MLKKCSKIKKKTFKFNQVQGWYYRQWNLYCAVRARENHTGGGDGDDFKIKLLEPDGEEDDEDGEGSSNGVKDEKSTDVKRSGNGGSKYYSSAQLDRFAQSVYCQDALR